ncbi:MAG TPA: hypothetical protein VHU14_06660 [Solirubrobacterales bacterium]|nr:hypothetical protein [Solirubrobacterales bacterium]
MQHPTSQDRPDVDLSDAEVAEYFRCREEMRAEEREAEAIEARQALADRRGSKGRNVTHIAARRHRRAPRPAGSRRRGTRRCAVASGDDPPDGEGDPEAVADAEAVPA